MSPSPSRSPLAHARASAWLPLLALLFFVLKIGSASACASHEFADAGVGAVEDAVLVLSDAGEDTSATLAGHAAACTHCSCHHSAAIVTSAQHLSTLTRTRLCDVARAAPPSALASFDLRPPIA